MKIPTKTDIEKYLRRFDPVGLGSACVERNLTPLNANNHFNWVVRKGGKHYVVRIAKPKGNLPTDIAIEYLTLSLLKGRGIAPQPHWIDSTGFIYPLLIEDFVEGIALKTKPDVSEIKMIARMLARLHNVEMPREIPLVDRSFNSRFSLLEERLKKAIGKPLVRKVAVESNFLPLLPRIKKFFRFASSFADRCPRVFLHGDLYPGNVLITKGGKAVLIDFQKPSVGDPTFDFGNLFVDIGWRKYYPMFGKILVREYLRHHDYPKLAKLFDLRMIERDITSIISEFRDAAAKLPQTNAALGRYFARKRPAWRILLIQQQLERLGI